MVREVGPSSTQWVMWWASHHGGGRPQLGKVQPLSLDHRARDKGWGDEPLGASDVQGLAWGAQDHGDDGGVAGELAGGLG